MNNSWQQLDAVKQNFKYSQPATRFPHSNRLNKLQCSMRTQFSVKIVIYAFWSVLLKCANWSNFGTQWQFLWILFWKFSLKFLWKEIPVNLEDCDLPDRLPRHAVKQAYPTFWFYRMQYAVVTTAIDFSSIAIGHRDNHLTPHITDVRLPVCAACYAAA